MALQIYFLRGNAKRPFSASVQAGIQYPMHHRFLSAQARLDWPCADVGFSRLHALDYQALRDEHLAIFLNGLFNDKRGKKEGTQLALPFTHKSPSPWTFSQQVALAQSLNLEKSVESRQSTQAIGAPSKSEKALITSKVTTSFSDSLCTPISYVSLPRSTDFSRLKNSKCSHTRLAMSLRGDSLLSSRICWTIRTDSGCARVCLIRFWVFMPLIMAGGSRIVQYYLWVNGRARLSKQAQYSD